MKYFLFILLTIPSICLAARQGEVGSTSSGSANITVIIPERVEANFSYVEEDTLLCLVPNNENSYRIENQKTGTNITKNDLSPNSQNCLDIATTEFKRELQDSVIMIYPLP
jgi:hypothetical protein